MLNDYLEKIEKMLSITITPLRKDIIKILYQSKKPMGAYDILKKLVKIRPNAKPPTVYRVLDYLKDANVIHKIETNNTYVCCQSSKICLTSVILTCEQCKRLIETSAPKILDEIRLLSKKKSFEVSHSPIEINGLCLDCSSSHQ